MWDCTAATAVPFQHRSCVWRWGRLYERIVRNYLNGGWKNDAPDSRAVSYWWGMDAGVIDLICSSSLPEGTRQLVSILQNAICSGSLSPSPQ